MKASRVLVALTGVYLIVTQQASACSVCMGAADDSMTRGMQVGILVLLGVIGGVLLCLGGFIGYLVHRGRLIARETKVGSTTPAILEAKATTPTEPSGDIQHAKTIS